MFYVNMKIQPQNMTTSAKLRKNSIPALLMRVFSLPCIYFVLHLLNLLLCVVVKSDSFRYVLPVELVSIFFLAPWSFTRKVAFIN